MCTSFIIKAQDGSPLYGRTMEWGGFDLKSSLALAQRGTSFTSALSDHTQGMVWKNKFGFISINPANLPYAMDGMNETGLTIGVLYLPGFAQYQDLVEGEVATTLSNVDFAAYILGQYNRVDDIKTVLPTLRVVENEDSARLSARLPLSIESSPMKLEIRSWLNTSEANYIFTITKLG